MKIAGSTISLVAVVSFSTSTSLATVPPPATQTLLNANPGMRVLFERQQMVALYGAPFATDDDPETDTDQFVEAFLAANPDALGVDGVSLRLKDKTNINDDKFTVYTYEQLMEDGLPRYGSMVKIPVLLGSVEKIGYIGISLHQAPDPPLPGDVITATQAVDVVSQSPAYAHLTNFTVPEKVIFADAGGMQHRAWQFAGYDADESYRFFVGGHRHRGAGGGA